MTPPRITVSVIVPAYNAETVLPLCLDAIVGSTYQPHEIIVVDDRSSDGTFAVARQRGVKILRMERQSGPGASRNLAAQVATGEILLFVDSDVVITADVIGRLARHLHVCR